jgi:hypothetical protein
MRFSLYSKRFAPGLLLLILILIVFILFVIAGTYLGNRYLIIRYIAYAVLMGFAFYSWKYITKYSFEKGLDGEHEVAKILKKLPTDYILLYDFQSKNDGNIDMVVIGPTGIWTIEVKNLDKKIISIENDQLFGDGYSIDKNRSQAYHEAIKLQVYLNTKGFFFPVNPILVFAGSKTEINLQNNHFKGVSVVGINEINDFIQKRNADERFTQEVCLKLAKEIKKQTSII